MSFVLVVEDDSAIRDSIREVLEDEGHVVVCAADGSHALTTLEELSSLPDLILLDLMMPVKDGFQFRAEQQANPRLARIPVVVLSAAQQLQTYDPRLAAVRYLAKPIEIELLLTTVEQASSLAGAASPESDGI